ncbi:glycerol 3-phosphate dehydrogenase (NAD(P)+) [[Clostridium] aminophilum]|uniref:Glycerol-3-phosphate dehydrogenase [NAD(P)+] n=1 Tax=[Clostridium] aminophilum TaxID=1526 RepID=A0A1I0DUA8_9FIRM|nr:NAD(P)H-dependent glycerol-3-phosphate dehydrogenase [[Clostridium] aminophilum]SET36076.1 glycerol 3-phosphate dehydrogenase (NAD(P)+) [[Clostridium] aminophilum]
MRKIGVLGAGAWGLALADLLSENGNDVILWSSSALKAENLKRERPAGAPKLQITADLKEATADRQIVLFVVSSVYVRSVAAQIRPFIRPDQIIVSAVKGVEADTLYTMTDILREELGNVPIVALSGPTLAAEVVMRHPTTILSASDDPEAAEIVQDAVMCDSMRAYTSDDVKGVELCGALKNVIALATGISDGLGFGFNARAALITRGLAEMIRLGKAMGCHEATFAGLAGLGDLVATATSTLSRNYRCGHFIGKEGYAPETAIAKVGQVVEGVNMLPAAMKLAERYQVEMPIARAVNSIIKEGADPKETVSELMHRRKKAETE